MQRKVRLLPTKPGRRLETEFLVRHDSDIDLIIFETLTTRSEIAGVAQLARQQDLGHFAVGLTCGADGKTLAGVSMAEAVNILAEVKPAIYFVQCTRFDFVQGALNELMSALGSSATAGVYANDGRVWENRSWHGERIEPQRYADEAVIWETNRCAHHWRLLRYWSGAYCQTHRDIACRVNIFKNKSTRRRT